MGKSPQLVIHADDPYGQGLVSLCLGKAHPMGAELHRFGMRAPAEFVGNDLSVAPEGISGWAEDVRNGVQVRVQSSMTGAFNAANILGVIAAARSMGLEANSISAGLKEMGTVPGRLERVPNDRGIHVFVDYAHKPDALSKVLETLLPLKEGHQLICVFGCGGDRDRKKRPSMGRIAVDHADKVIITSDNPRTEDPQAIIHEILAGLPAGAKNFEVIVDREAAIARGVALARPGDVLLIAGKGHEDYQIIADSRESGGTRKIHFDDREVAVAHLRRK
jgi:UDP-N-acetylmuramoyl-L-alanyl-D-glutamate--2,6-diaminopimelate ligase